MLKEALLGALRSIRDFFAARPRTCNGCIAKDYHISCLQEEKRLINSLLNSQLDKIDNITERQFTIIEHYTGIDRARNAMRIDAAGTKPETLHRVARDHSIGNRIRKAEDAHSDEVLQVQ